jgi:16S rRNA G966 N2-methylase RsmD
MEANEANASLLKRQVQPLKANKKKILQNLSKFTPFASLYSDPAYAAVVRSQGQVNYERICLNK